MIFFACAILFFVIRNNKKDASRIQHKKYTVVKIINAEVFGKNSTKFTFYLDGKYRNNYSNLMWRSERDSIIGKKALIEFDSTNVDNSEIVFGYIIPENITIPINGWKNIPPDIRKKQ